MVESKKYESVAHHEVLIKWKTVQVVSFLQWEKQSFRYNILREATIEMGAHCSSCCCNSSLCNLSFIEVFSIDQYKAWVGILSIHG